MGRQKNNEPEEVVAEEKPLFNVTFRENASIEIYVGGKRLRFEAHTRNPVFPAEYKDGVPADVVNHPDFKSVSKLFVTTAKI